MNNCVYIACLGKNYEIGIKNAIRKGIFGDSVNIRIYKDSDVENVWVNQDYANIFKSISIYKNMKDKDYGVNIDNIDAKRIVKIK